MKFFEEKLDLTPVEDVSRAVVIKGGEQKEESADATDAEQDFITARANIQNVLTQANEAMQIAFEIAKDSESPKAFDSLNSILKTIVDSSTELIEIHKKKKDLKELPKQNLPVVPGQPTTHIQNMAVFSGTATDLQAMIKKMAQKD